MTTTTGSLLERAALIERSRRLVQTPERQSLRDARKQRRRALSGYKNALDQTRSPHCGALKEYAAALSAEAAANRAEANELRELLAALVGVEIGGQR